MVAHPKDRTTQPHSGDLDKNLTPACLELSIANMTANRASDSPFMASLSTAVVEPAATARLPKCRFLDLPPGLRERIHEDVLVTSRPIELAPLCQYELSPDFYVGCDYHRRRYITNILPRANLWRPSKLTAEAGTPIFYGQAFRFSSEVGWLVLGHWLKKIGPSRHDMVKHITVGYSGRLKVPGEWAFHKEHLQYALGASPLVSILPKIRTHPIHMDETLCLLSTMPRLQRLRLVIIAEGMRIEYG